MYIDDDEGWIREGRSERERWRPIEKEWRASKVPIRTKGTRWKPHFFSLFRPSLARKKHQMKLDPRHPCTLSLSSKKRVARDPINTLLRAPIQRSASRCSLYFLPTIDDFPHSQGGWRVCHTADEPFVTQVVPAHQKTQRIIPDSFAYLDTSTHDLLDRY